MLKLLRPSRWIGCLVVAWGTVSPSIKMRYETGNRLMHIRLQHAPVLSKVTMDF